MKKIATFFVAILMATTLLTAVVPVHAHASTQGDIKTTNETTEKTEADLITPYSYEPHPEAGGGFERVFTQYGNSKNANTISGWVNRLAAGAVGGAIAAYAPWAHSWALGVGATSLIDLFSGTSVTEYYTVTTYIYYGNGNVADRTRVVTEVYRDSARTQLKGRRSNFLNN